jgi:hypothetical protein
MEVYDQKNIVIASHQPTELQIDKLLLVSMLHEEDDKVRLPAKTPPASLLTNFMLPNIWMFIYKFYKVGELLDILKPPSVVVNPSPKQHRCIFKTMSYLRSCFPG